MNFRTWVAILLVLFICVGLFVLAHAVPPRCETVSLDDIRRQGHSGDLLLFASDVSPMGLNSAWRRALWRSPWSHSAILYLDPTTRTPYIWEANLRARQEFEYVDVISGIKNKIGCQLVLLEEKLKTYQGYCVWCALRPGLEQLVHGGAPEVDRRFRQIFQTCRHLTFNNSASWTLFLISTSLFGVQPNLSTCMRLRAKVAVRHALLCSELTTYTYYLFGVWREDDEAADDETLATSVRHRNLFLPHDFERPQVLGALTIASMKQIVYQF